MHPASFTPLEAVPHRAEVPAYTLPEIYALLSLMALLESDDPFPLYDRLATTGVDLYDVLMRLTAVDIQCLKEFIRAARRRQARGEIVSAEVLLPLLRAISERPPPIVRKPHRHRRSPSPEATAAELGLIASPTA